MRRKDLLPLASGTRWAALAIVLVGAAVESPELMSLGTFGFCFAHAARDYFSPGRESINSLTFFAVSAALGYGLANFAAYVLKGTRFGAVFYDWEVLDWTFQAQAIASLGVLTVLLSHDVLERLLPRKQASPLPSIATPISDRLLFRSTLGLAVLCWGGRAFGVGFGGFGLMGTLVTLGPNVAIFVLRLRWLTGRSRLPKSSAGLPFVIAIGETISALFFSFLRSQILWPLVALFFPYILAKKVKGRHLAAVLCVVVLMLPLFQQWGEVRSRRTQGRQRIQLLLSGASDPVGDPFSGGLATLAARFSTFNQLNQVVRVAEEDGFYEGETISYVVYAFIPRVIWPEKPIIAPSQWFARRLGRGAEREGGTFSNAINMTIFGEFYVNFGFSGVFVGSVLFALLHFLLWRASNFHGRGSNMVGHVLAYVLILQSLSTSHLGGPVSLVMWYVFCLGLHWVVPWFDSKKARQRDLATRAQSGE